MYMYNVGTTDGVLSDHRGPPYPPDIQCYFELPKPVSYTFEFGIFVMLGLSGKEEFLCQQLLLDKLAE